MSQRLSPRERVRRVLTRQSIDRIPNGLCGTETATLHLLAYEKLKQVLGVASPKNRMTTFMTTALGEIDVLEAMEADIVLLNSRMCAADFWGSGVERQWKDVCFWGKTFQAPREWYFHTDADGTIWWENNGWKCAPGGYYFDPVPKPSDPAADQPKPEDYNPPHDLPDEALRALEEGARWLYETTDFSIFVGETITDLQLNPGGFEAWCMRLVDDPDAVHAFLHRACEAALDQLRLVDQAVGRYADMMMIADDIGDRRGVTIGPRLWREIYKPHYKQLFTSWHEITEMKVHLHSCGSIYSILPDLIECGVDVINPVQVSAQNMEPTRLQSEFGEAIIFYGGAYDAVQTPPYVTADEVYDTVKENIQALSRSGGYIFAGEHNIPADTPIEHLRAIWQAYLDCRYLVAEAASG